MSTWEKCVCSTVISHMYARRRATILQCDHTHTQWQRRRQRQRRWWWRDCCCCCWARSALHTFSAFALYISLLISMSRVVAVRHKHNNIQIYKLYTRNIIYITLWIHRLCVFLLLLLFLLLALSHVRVRVCVFSVHASERLARERHNIISIQRLVLHKF